MQLVTKTYPSNFVIFDKDSDLYIQCNITGDDFESYDDPNDVEVTLYVKLATIMNEYKDLPPDDYNTLKEEVSFILNLYVMDYARADIPFEDPAYEPPGWLDVKII